MRLAVGGLGHALADRGRWPLKIERAGVVVLLTPPGLEALVTVAEDEQGIDVALLCRQAEDARDWPIWVAPAIDSW